MKRSPFYFLLRREIHRFMTIAKMTLLPPIISTGLYIVVFGLAIGGSIATGNIGYSTFILPGIIFMNLVTPPFSNATFSIFEGRWNEHIHERLQAPVSHHMLIWSVVLASMTRGFLVAGSLFLIFTPLLNVTVADSLGIVLLAFLSTFTFSLVGIITGLWAEDWDQAFTLQPFILTPLLFLGGVFFELSMLPAPWNRYAAYNPLYYLVDAFRNAMTGSGATPPGIAILILGVAAAVLYGLVYYLYETGWKLRD